MNLQSSSSLSFVPTFLSLILSVIFSKQILGFFDFFFIILIFSQILPAPNDYIKIYCSHVICIFSSHDWNYNHAIGKSVKSSSDLEPVFVIPSILSTRILGPFIVVVALIWRKSGNLSDSPYITGFSSLFFSILKEI